MSTTTEDRSPGQVLCTRSGTPHDFPGAGGDMLERPPPLGQRREPALAQAACRPQERIPGTGIDIELFHAGRFRYRDVDPVTCSFVARIGQGGHGVQARPQHRQHILPGRGQVMDIAGQHIRDPQRDNRGIEQRLDVPAGIMSLPRVPQVDRLPPCG